VECVNAAIAGQWRSKHVSVATSKHATMEELLDAVFSVQSMLKLYNDTSEVDKSSYHSKLHV
jgi:hypothetical protein